MTRLLQISDLHFGTEQPDVMAALLTLSNNKKPDVLVVSGDITQRATAEQFKNAKAFCDSLRIAQARAYEVADRVHFAGSQMRRDIGFRGLERRHKDATTGFGPKSTF